MCPYLLFLVVNMCLFVDSKKYINDNYNIQLNLTKKTYNKRLYEIKHVFVVLNHRPFVIKLLNYLAKGISCGYGGNEYQTFFEIVNESGVLNSIVEFSSATDDMTGTWECKIKRLDHTVPPRITFKVRVKGSEHKRIKIKIGERDQKLILTNSSELTYDEVGTYQYLHGETVDLVCSNERSNGQIYLRYYDATDETLIKTGEINKSNDNNRNLMFQKTLYNTHNYHKIDCTYVTAKDQLEFTSRVIFILNNASSETDVRIVINNVQLVPHQKSIHYYFKCFPEEILTVTCELLKDDDLKLHIFDGNDLIPLKGIVEHEGTGNKMKTFTIKSISVKHSIACIAFNVQKVELIARIFFKNREYPKLRILGLNAIEVIDQYTNTSKDWVIDYAFKAGQVLNITCVSSRTGNLTLQESSRMQNYSRNATIISQTFSLEDRHHNSRITCYDGNNETDYKRKVIIKLYRYTFVPDAEHDTQVNNNLIIGCAVSLLVLVVMGSFVVYWRKNNSRIKQTDSNRLQDLEPPPPVDIASTSIDGGNSSDTREHVYQYIDVDDICPTKKHETRPSPQDNGDRDNVKYDYAYAAGHSEVKLCSPPSIDSAQNNTIYYWNASD